MSADRVAVDANILVYAVYRDTPQHAASRAWLERAVRGEVKICLTSQVLVKTQSCGTLSLGVSS